MLTFSLISEGCFEKCSLKFLKLKLKNFFHSSSLYKNFLKEEPLSTEFRTISLSDKTGSGGLKKASVSFFELSKNCSVVKKKVLKTAKVGTSN